MVKNKEAADEEMEMPDMELKSDNDTVETNIASTPVNGTFKQKSARFFRTKKGKAVGVIVVLAAAIGVLCAVPATRYGMFGAFMKKNVDVIVMDSSTKKPVSQATVRIGDKDATTNSKGEATVDTLPVGKYTVRVTKKYYKDAEMAYVVPILSKPGGVNVNLEATGRQVTVNVTNKISQVTLAKATVTVSGTSAITDSAGEASLVLPADQKTLDATVKLDGYNDATTKIKVTDQAGVNKVSLTPSGTIFYLSKQTGKINVMKSNLDGTDPRVVVEGTGNENDNTTVLLAARDWKYMALSASRTGEKGSELYLVNAATGKLNTVDKGDADIQLVGWSNHRFIYLVDRHKPEWSNKKQTLKSYDAETGKITVLDETVGSGTNYYDMQREAITKPYILEGKVVYAKVWQLGDDYTYRTTKKQSVIMSVNPDGTHKVRNKEFAMQHYIDIIGRLYEPQGIYFRVSADDGAAKYYEFEDGSVREISNSDDKFYNAFYPTYLISPTGKKTFWYEPRDGKNILFVGDSNGLNGKELAKQSDYTAYGWYSDDYVLLSKNDSELYVAPVNSADHALKITNYHKPAIRYPGYGYGYGGN